MIEGPIVVISKGRLEFLVVARFAAEQQVNELRERNEQQRDLLRSALLELARELDAEPTRFRRQWMNEHTESGYL